MIIKLSEEQELLLEGIRELAERVLTDDYVRSCDENHQRPAKLIDALVENGYYSLGVPEEYGGTPVSHLTYFLMAAENGPVKIYAQNRLQAPAG